MRVTVRLCVKIDLWIQHSNNPDKHHVGSLECHNVYSRYDWAARRQYWEIVLVDKTVHHVYPEDAHTFLAENGGEPDPDYDASLHAALLSQSV